MPVCTQSSLHHIGLHPEKYVFMIEPQNLKDSVRSENIFLNNRSLLSQGKKHGHCSSTHSNEGEP